MKKYILPILFLSLCAVTGMLRAQNQISDVKIHTPNINKVGELVTVEFTAEIGPKAVKPQYYLIFGPEFTDGNYRWSLPPIIVQGRRARISMDRQVMASGREYLFEDAVFTRNGETINYSASIPYQEWMEGAQLEIAAIKAGCCSESELTTQLMADNLTLQPPAEPVIIRDTVIIETPLSTGDKLTHSYAFVAPADQYRKIQPGELYDEDRENTIQIHFALSKYNVDRQFANNARSLTDIMASIRILENSIDSRVKAIVIAGFASPEGGFELNDKLAWNRAVAVKTYIVEHSDLEPETVEIYNGSADWQGLRMLIEKSDVAWRERALEIIDTVPIWDAQRNVGRLGELMRLERGDPYRYMAEHWFPLLRNSAYIKVYYENK